MSKQMKVIMENWRSNLLLEQEVLSIHERLIEEFTNEIKIIRESSDDLNEVLSKVADFAKKAYNTYSDIKKKRNRSSIDQSNRFSN